MTNVGYMYFAEVDTISRSFNFKCEIKAKIEPSLLVIRIYQFNKIVWVRDFYWSHIEFSP